MIMLRVALFAFCLAFAISVRADTGTVTFDFNTTIRTGSPYVFGGCKFAMPGQQDKVYPKLKDAGITFLRADFYFQLIIPASKCASVDDYKNNVNRIQNPDGWDYAHLYWIDDSRKCGFKTFITTTYTPTWLSCSGMEKGVPKDWNVWEEIVRKVYGRYRTRVDWIETWNEIEYWGDLTGSPYTSKEDYLADNFYHTVKAIRDAGGTIPTGGFAFAYDSTGKLKDTLKIIVAKYGWAWTDANFNFYSVHHYGSDPGNINWSDIFGAFREAGLNPNRGVFVDEWNYTTDWGRRPGELYDAKAIGYAGKSLASFINHGVNAAYYSMYPSDSPVQDMDGAKTLLAFYTTNGNVTPLPQSYPFKILSNRLGLGKGIYVVKKVSNQTVIDACCAVNSAGQKVAFIANYHGSPNTVNITFRGLFGERVQITDFYANTWDPSCNAYKTITNMVVNGQASHVINMPANTCVGLILAATNEVINLSK